MKIPALISYRDATSSREFVVRRRERVLDLRVVQRLNDDDLSVQRSLTD